MTANKKKKRKLPNYKILAKSIREYKKPSIITPIFVTLVVIIQVIIPLVMAQLIDNMSGNSLDPIYKYGIMLVAFAILSLIFGFFAGKYSAVASTGFAKNLRKDLFYKVQDFSFAEIDKFSTSSLVTRLTTDVTNVQRSYQMLIRIAIRTPLMMVFSFIMSFSISWQLALIFVVIIPVLLFSLFLIARSVMPLFKRIFKKYDNLNRTVQENVSAIRVVKSFVREDYENKKFDIAATDVKNDYTKAEKILAINRPMMMFFIYIGILAVSYFGAIMIVDTAGVGLTTGQLSSLITYSTQILISIMMLSMVFIMISMSLESINRIIEVLETDTSISNNENGIKEVKDGSVTFKDLYFKYDKNAEKYVLEKINLNIESGQTIGILGGTGSAKTTLIQLISRLYDTSQGQVLVGGKDVKDYNLKALRDQVSVVLQKNVLFSGSVAENLRWGNKDATFMQLEQAAKIAQADEFIKKLPGKYDYHLERGGSNVSGGQKQRLCIARALLKNPKILIFDDSTSAVDTKTNQKITNALQSKLKDTTKIIIAQRVNSIKHADKIIILDKGKIISMGTHEELIKNSDIYNDIYKAQNNLEGVQNA